MKFRDFISDISASFSSCKDNISEDAVKITGINNHITDFVREYKYVHKHEYTDPNLSEGTMNEYKSILYNLKDIDGYIDIAEGELNTIAKLIIKLDKHIKSGFVHYEDWEPPAWKQPEKRT